MTESSKLDARWRDFDMGYTAKVGREVAAKNLPTLLIAKLDVSVALLEKVTQVLEPGRLSAAVASSDAGGDPELTRHVAQSFVDLYKQMLAWSESVRSLRVDDEWVSLRDLAESWMDAPIRDMHDFIDRYVDAVETGIAALGNAPGGHLEVKLAVLRDEDLELFERIHGEIRVLLKKTWWER